MALYDDARLDVPCAVCGAQADDRCNWGCDPAQGLPCERPVCWGCAVVTTDAYGGADIWCPEHAMLAPVPTTMSNDF
jgi:hypothetical protein